MVSRRFHLPDGRPVDELLARGWVTWTAVSERTGTTPGIAKRRKRSAARGTQGVAQRRSNCEAGGLASEDPVEGRALPADGPRGGNQAESLVAPCPVTATSRDSGRGVRQASAEA